MNTEPLKEKSEVTSERIDESIINLKRANERLERVLNTFENYDEDKPKAEETCYRGVAQVWVTTTERIQRESAALNDHITRLEGIFR